MGTFCVSLHGNPYFGVQCSTLPSISKGGNCTKADANLIFWLNLRINVLGTISVFMTNTEQKGF